jgi:hypothetical protein
MTWWIAPPGPSEHVLAAEALVATTAHVVSAAQIAPAKSLPLRKTASSWV